MSQSDLNAFPGAGAFPDQGVFPDQGWLDAALLGLLGAGMDSIFFAVVSLAAAVAIGAGHALGPGHGKVLIGAYLAGSQGRTRDAVTLGGIVGVMHTGSVLALGLVLYTTQRMPLGETITAVLTLISAIAVATVGGILLRKHVEALLAHRRLSGELVAAGATIPVRDLQHHHHGHHHHPPADGTSPLFGPGCSRWPQPVVCCRVRWPSWCSRVRWPSAAPGGG